jgi:hypothetical protein
LFSRESLKNTIKQLGGTALYALVHSVMTYTIPTEAFKLPTTSGALILTGIPAALLDRLSANAPNPESFSTTLVKYSAQAAAVTGVETMMEAAFLSRERHNIYLQSTLVFSAVFLANLLVHTVEKRSLQLARNENWKEGVEFAFYWLIYALSQDISAELQDTRIDEPLEIIGGTAINLSFSLLGVLFAYLYSNTMMHPRGLRVLYTFGQSIAEFISFSIALIENTRFSYSPIAFIPGLFAAAVEAGCKGSFQGHYVERNRRNERDNLAENESDEEDQGLGNPENNRLKATIGQTCFFLLNTCLTMAYYFFLASSTKRAVLMIMGNEDDTRFPLSETEFTTTILACTLMNLPFSTCTEVASTNRAIAKYCFRNEAYPSNNNTYWSSFFRLAIPRIFLNNSFIQFMIMLTGALSHMGEHLLEFFILLPANGLRTLMQEGSLALKMLTTFALVTVAATYTSSIALETLLFERREARATLKNITNTDANIEELSGLEKYLLRKIERLQFLYRLTRFFIKFGVIIHTVEPLAPLIEFSMLLNLPAGFDIIAFFVALGPGVGNLYSEVGESLHELEELREKAANPPGDQKMTRSDGDGGGPDDGRGGPHPKNSASSLNTRLLTKDERRVDSQSHRRPFSPTGSEENLDPRGSAGSSPIASDDELDALQAGRKSSFLTHGQFSGNGTAQGTRPPYNLSFQ